MASLTRSNIAYDFNISPHKIILKYDTQDITFVFSSNLYKNKFLAKIVENREKINNSISSRFGMTIKNDVLCDLKLYTTIEKRGFLIYIDEEKIECLKSIILDGETLMLQS